MCAPRAFDPGVAEALLRCAAKDFLTDFERNNRPPFRIKYWEQPNIETLARENGELLQRFFASGTPFTPSDAEHIEQCETAGCRHPAVYVNPTDPADTAQGWCALCREVAHQQQDELLARATQRRRRSRSATDPGA